MLKEEWESPKKKVMNVCDWVDRLRKRLEIVREVVNEREKDAKVKMKSMYDKRAEERELIEGQIVFTKIPRLGNKLDDAWEGPYEVIRKISNTNYEIAVPHRRAKTKIVHINNLKTWKQEEARIYRIVIAADDMPDLEDGLKLHGSVATATQLEQLAIIKQKFAEVLNRFDAVSAYMRKKDHYGLSDFLKISHIR